MAEVKITISNDGSQVDVDADGFVGSSCTNFMDKVIKAIGTVEKEGKKPAYFETEHSGISIGRK